MFISEVAYKEGETYLKCDLEYFYSYYISSLKSTYFYSVQNFMEDELLSLISFECPDGGSDCYQIAKRIKSSPDIQYWLRVSSEYLWDIKAKLLMLYKSGKFVFYSDSSPFCTYVHQLDEAKMFSMSEGNYTPLRYAYNGGLTSRMIYDENGIFLGQAWGYGQIEEISGIKHHCKLVRRSSCFTVPEYDCCLLGTLPASDPLSFSLERFIPPLSKINGLI